MAGADAEDVNKDDLSVNHAKWRGFLMRGPRFLEPYGNARYAALDGIGEAPTVPAASIHYANQAARWYVLD